MVFTWSTENSLKISEEAMPQKFNKTNRQKHELSSRITQETIIFAKISFFTALSSKCSFNNGWCGQKEFDKTLQNVLN